MPVGGGRTWVAASALVLLALVMPACSADGVDQDDDARMIAQHWAESVTAGEVDTDDLCDGADVDLGEIGDLSAPEVEEVIGESTSERVIHIEWETADGEDFEAVVTVRLDGGRPCISAVAPSG